MSLAANMLCERAMTATTVRVDPDLVACHKIFRPFHHANDAAHVSHIYRRLMTDSVDSLTGSDNAVSSLFARPQICRVNPNRSVRPRRQRRVFKPPARRMLLGIMNATRTRTYWRMGRSRPVQTLLDPVGIGRHQTDGTILLPICSHFTSSSRARSGPRLSPDCQLHFPDG